MKAIYLTKYGKSSDAFEIRECSKPEPGPNSVLIKVETFGLNFADVMARNGLYRAAPPLPCILGYEVVGVIERRGEGVEQFENGQKVVAFTRFGGYAEYAVTDYRAVAPLPEDYDICEAAALPTQYGTAYHCACDLANIRQGEHVLIHAAAGGVGIALTQLAKLKGCIVYGTVSSDEKMQLLEKQGVDYPINYSETDYAKAILKIRGNKKMDAIFNPIGGKFFKTDRKILGYGGRLIGFGASDRLGRRKNIFSKYKLLLDFGFIHPVGLLVSSTTVGGANMLKLADHKPEILRRCLENVTDLAIKGKIKPYVGGRFGPEELSKAHELLENRKSLGKLVIRW
ncbi:MAG: zinc-binding dehydrogenase [Bacteroidales bacterium]|nr:MAG: zinc-binding dehydrogenase [Bacteroidales bacterium]